MSDLQKRVLDDVKAAMRAGDKDRLTVLRMLSAELKQREVVESTTITDAVVTAAVEKMVKQRRDSETSSAAATGQIWRTRKRPKSRCCSATCRSS